MPTLEPLIITPPRHAFSAYGIELEYMMVDAQTLTVQPLADQLLRDAEGRIVNELERGELAWSNELVAHVIELKTNGPAASLAGLDQRFHADIVLINRRLAASGARLLPTAMHPLFDPARETRLWAHGQRDIYAAYDRIFGCRGHGWSNLQSMHINLPFFDDQEFVRLHAAVRVVLPLIPALAAASPLEQGRRTPWLDQRLWHYRGNQRAVPEIAGGIVPEPVTSIGDYHERVLAPMFRAIAPLDSAGILNGDWLNSRAAIARFERQTIEIRIIDLQECPAADLAMAELIVALVRAFYEERLATLGAQQELASEGLAAVLWRAAESGSAACIDDSDYLRLFGLSSAMSAGAVWRRLLSVLELPPQTRSLLERLLQRGSLAEAIVEEIGPQVSPQAILDCYRALGLCLDQNQPFRC